MSLLTSVSAALLVAWPSASPQARTADTLMRTPIPASAEIAAPAAEEEALETRLAADSLAVPLVSARPAALARRHSDGSATAPDTVPKRRAKAVVYSEGYGKRLAIHKALSWAMLPLFAVSYVSGDQLIEKGSDAPDWARSIHPIAATSTAVLFGANAVTGTWNLWESRRDPNGRVKRIVHGALFMVASGGFAYTGTKLAEDAQERQAKRGTHRNMAIASMGVSTASWLIMLIGN